MFSEATASLARHSQIGTNPQKSERRFMLKNVCLRLRCFCVKNDSHDPNNSKGFLS